MDLTKLKCFEVTQSVTIPRAALTGTFLQTVEPEPKTMDDKSHFDYGKHDVRLRKGDLLWCMPHQSTGVIVERDGQEALRFKYHTLGLFLTSPYVIQRIVDHGVADG